MYVCMYMFCFYTYLYIYICDMYVYNITFHYTILYYIICIYIYILSVGQGGFGHCLLRDTVDTVCSVTSLLCGTADVAAV